MCVESLSSAHHSANTYTISFAIFNTRRYGCLLGFIFQEKNHRLKGTRDFNFLNNRPEIQIIHLSKKGKKSQVYKNLATRQGSEAAGLGKEKRIGEILLRLDTASAESTVEVPASAKHLYLRVSVTVGRNVNPGGYLINLFPSSTKYLHVL